uniref:Putative secreted protein n=1 Tax=Anopheles darlingi TaxID=43151 RepID=A0A2M4DCQ3_ANODA
MCRLVLIAATAELVSLGITSPRKSKQQAIYLPIRGSHLTIVFSAVKQAFVISATELLSWDAFDADISGA